METSLIIDGRQGEGGGQVLRSSLAFSALTQKPFTIHHIRGNRATPGLRAQHLACVRLAARLCGARLQGDAIASNELKFEPGPLVAGYHEIDIGTAGSLSLLTQSVLIPALACKKSVELVLRGGTDVSWSPPMDYLQNVVLPYYRCLGRIEMEVEKRGFMPAGQGLIRLNIEGHDQNVLPLNITEKVSDFQACGRVVASDELREARICERIASRVQASIGISLDTEYLKSKSVSVVATLWGHSGPTRIGCGMLGQRGLKAERLAAKLSQRWREVRQHEHPVGEYLADQLIPLLALCGGEIHCQKISQHCRTNAEICGLFTGTEFLIEDGCVQAKLTQRS